jgi:hypothetical protein
MTRREVVLGAREKSKEPSPVFVAFMQKEKFLKIVLDSGSPLLLT